MKIEDLLNKLIKSYDKNKKLKDKYNEDTMRFILNVEETEILLNYIAYLQRKEYNNSKAIEYIERAKYVTETMEGEEFYKNYEYSMEDLLNILEKGE